MEKKGCLYEIVIKSTYFIIGVIGLILIINGLINIFPMLNSFSLQYSDMHTLILNTEFAEAYKTFSYVDYFNGALIIEVLVSFIANLPIFSLLFLILTTTLGILYFVFVKWDLLRVYFKLSLIHIVLFLIKYIFFGLSLLIFYTSDIKSLATGLFVGTVCYIIISLIQIFLHSLWILKFILNIGEDIKEYNNC